MIIFDGDSVLAPIGFGIPEEKSWPHIVAAGTPYRNFAISESTAAKCLMRLWRIFDLCPKCYILQIGQWSQNHEVLPDFERNVRAIIEDLNQRNIPVTLVTPPIQLVKRFNVDEYVKVLYRCSRIYKTEFVDLKGHMETVGNVQDWFIQDAAMCHFNEHGAEQVAKYFNDYHRR